MKIIKFVWHMCGVGYVLYVSAPTIYKYLYIHIYIRMPQNCLSTIYVAYIFIKQYVHVHACVSKLKIYYPKLKTCARHYNKNKIIILIITGIYMRVSSPVYIRKNTRKGFSIFFSVDHLLYIDRLYLKSNNTAKKKPFSIQICITASFQV